MGWDMQHERRRKQTREDAAEVPAVGQPRTRDDTTDRADLSCRLYWPVGKSIASVRVKRTAMPTCPVWRRLVLRTFPLPTTFPDEVE